MIVKGVAEMNSPSATSATGISSAIVSSSRHWPLTISTTASGAGQSSPAPRTSRAGSNRPLARPLFIYVNAKRIERPEVKAFARYFVRKARELAGEAGSVPMMGMAYTLAEQRLEKMNTGTMFKAPNAAESAWSTFSPNKPVTAM